MASGSLCEARKLHVESSPENHGTTRDEKRGVITYKGQSNVPRTVPTLLATEHHQAHREEGSEARETVV